MKKALEEQLIEKAARAIAREFLRMDCAELDEKDYEEDFTRNRDMYCRMAAAALKVIQE